MKKTILKLLRGDGSEENYTLDRKELRKAACKLHLEIEDKAERKEKFNQSISKLESRGKILIDKSVVKLIAPSVQCNEIAADVCEASSASVVRKDKKRKAPQPIIDEGSICKADVEQIDEGSKKKKEKKAAKTVDDTEKKSDSGDASTIAAVVSGDTEPAQSAKKEYPPMEVQTGDNTILLFYAYCVPIMSRGEWLRSKI